MPDFDGTDFDADAPVIVAVGETSGKSLGLEWPSPSDLAGAAITAALADSDYADKLSAAIDCVAAIRTFEDSGVSMSTGSPDNVPEAYAKAGGVSARHFIYADVGGQSPQALVNELAGALQRGEYKAVLIASAEANGTAKRARKQSMQLDWTSKSDTIFDDRLSAFPILSRSEIRHGIVSMPLAYSLIENARRIQLAMDEASYQEEMAALWSDFSKISLTREHAQFAKEWSKDGLLSPDNGNYQLTSVYKRWMVAQDAVDLGAAIIMTTAGAARDMGIAYDKLIWLAGAAEASEPPYTERASLSESGALQFAIEHAFAQTALHISDLGPVDIYSCFPCAVFAGRDALGDLQRAGGDCTLTGGLSFFGGPGNGYAMHSITAMVQAMRMGGTKAALICANGGVMSKQAVGIYTPSQPDRRWKGSSATGYSCKKIELDPAPEGKAKICTHVRSVARGDMGGEMGNATLVIETEKGTRGMAMLEGSAHAHLDHAIVDIVAGEKRHIASLV